MGKGERRDFRGVDHGESLAGTTRSRVTEEVQTTEYRARRSRGEKLKESAKERPSVVLSPFPLLGVYSSTRFSRSFPQFFPGFLRFLMNVSVLKVLKIPASCEWLLKGLVIFLVIPIHIHVYVLFKKYYVQY